MKISEKGTLEKEHQEPTATEVGYLLQPAEACNKSQARVINTCNKGKTWKNLRDNLIAPTVLGTQDLICGVFDCD